jgi:hypothetical protein
MTVGTDYVVASGGLLVDDNGTTGANFLVNYIAGDAQYDAVHGQLHQICIRQKKRGMEITMGMTFSKAQASTIQILAKAGPDPHVS